MSAVKKNNKKLYKDPIQSTVRETVANAIDATIKSGSNSEVSVITPTPTNSVFKVIDHGCGMSKDELYSDFLKYDTLSRLDDLDQVGLKSLKSMTPLAYTKIFMITTVKDGHKLVVNINRNDDVNSGQPIFDTQLLFDDGTDEPNGTIVEIPVAATDIDKFTEVAEQYLHYTNDMTNITVNGRTPVFNEEWVKVMDVLVGYENGNEVNAPLYMKRDPSEQLDLMTDWVKCSKERKVNSEEYRRKFLKRHLIVSLAGWGYLIDERASRSSRNLLLVMEPGVINFSTSRETIRKNDKNYIIDLIVHEIYTTDTKLDPEPLFHVVKPSNRLDFLMSALNNTDDFIDFTDTLSEDWPEIKPMLHDYNGTMLSSVFISVPNYSSNTPYPYDNYVVDVNSHDDMLAYDLKKTDTINDYLNGNSRTHNRTKVPLAILDTIFEYAARKVNNNMKDNIVYLIDGRMSWYDSYQHVMKRTMSNKKYGYVAVIMCDGGLTEETTDEVKRMTSAAGLELEVIKTDVPQLMKDKISGSSRTIMAKIYYYNNATTLKDRLEPIYHDMRTSHYSSSIDMTTKEFKDSIDDNTIIYMIPPVETTENGPTSTKAFDSILMDVLRTGASNTIAIVRSDLKDVDDVDFIKDHNVALVNHTTAKRNDGDKIGKVRIINYMDSTVSIEPVMKDILHNIGLIDEWPELMLELMVLSYDANNIRPLDQSVINDVVSIDDFTINIATLLSNMKISGNGEKDYRPLIDNKSFNIEENLIELYRMIKNSELKHKILDSILVPYRYAIEIKMMMIPGIETSLEDKLKIEIAFGKHGEFTFDNYPTMYAPLQFFKITLMSDVLKSVKKTISKWS